MREQTIKDLHKLGNPELKRILEELFPKAFEIDFDVVPYLKDVLESANNIEYESKVVSLSKNGELLLTFSKHSKHYCLPYSIFVYIQKETKLGLKKIKKLCTTELNSITGWEATTTSFFYEAHLRVLDNPEIEK